MDNHEEAARLTGEQLALARAVGTPLALGTALRACASVGQNKAELLEEAIAQFESVGARYDLALALAALGACQRRDGQMAQARYPLRRALELAEKTGAAPLRDYARRELAAAGASMTGLGVDVGTGLVVGRFDAHPRFVRVKIWRGYHPGTDGRLAEAR